MQPPMEGVRVSRSKVCHLLQLYILDVVLCVFRFDCKISIILTSPSRNDEESSEE